MGKCVGDRIDECHIYLPTYLPTGLLDYLDKQTTYLLM